VKLDKEMLTLASELIKRKTHKFDPEKFKSHYATALRALINEKRKTGEVSHATDEELNPKGQSNVIDLMEALRNSVKGKTSPHAKASTAKRGGARKTTARKSTARKAPAKHARKKAS
jgi:DNA end-binding protein Ku